MLSILKYKCFNYSIGSNSRRGSIFGGTLDPIFDVGPLFMDAIVAAPIVATIESNKIFFIRF